MQPTKPMQPAVSLGQTRGGPADTDVGSGPGSRPGPGSGSRGVLPADVDLSIDVGPLKLANPIMTASGTAGLGLEMEPFYELSVAGAIVVKTITKAPRKGNPLPRLAETPSGLLNSIGLPNKGIDVFIERTLPRLAGKARCLRAPCCRDTQHLAAYTSPVIVRLAKSEPDGFWNRRNPNSGTIASK